MWHKLHIEFLVRCYERTGLLEWHEHVVMTGDEIGWLLELGKDFDHLSLLLRRLLLQTDLRDFLHLNLLLFNVLFSPFFFDFKETLAYLLFWLTQFSKVRCCLIFIFIAWAFYIRWLVVRYSCIWRRWRAVSFWGKLLTSVLEIHVVIFIKTFYRLLLTVDFSNIIMLLILIAKFLLFLRLALN